MRFYLAFLASFVFSQASAETVYTFGIGVSSCQTWLSGNDIQGINWITGFWSGANSFNQTNHVVGDFTDTNGLVGEVKLYCYQHPSETLFTATDYVYRQMMFRSRR